MVCTWLLIELITTEMDNAPDCESMVHRYFTAPSLPLPLISKDVDLDLLPPAAVN